MKPENRKKILATILAISSVSLACVHILSWPQDHRQYRNLQSVKEWLDKEEPKIAGFAKDEGIELYVGSYTDFNGVVFVNLTDVDDSETSRTLEFIRSLNPPRPVWWNIQYQDERYETFLDERSNSTP